MTARVLVACEFSGTVRDAFLYQGFDAWSCDILPTECPGPHIEGDILNHLDENWDLMIAHPPCTYLANSGVRWLYGGKGTDRDEVRWRQMEDAAQFFWRLLNAPIPHIAVENPIMHRYAVEIIGRKQDQLIQPWQFGHGETKATCLWLSKLPLLKPTNTVDGRAGRIHHESPGPDRWKRRSVTYTGIAQAMASQWGAYVTRNQIERMESA